VEQAELVLMVIPTPFVTEALGLKNPPPPLFCSLLFTCPSIHCSSLPTHSAMQPHFPAPCLGAFCLPLLFAASVSTFPLFFAPFHKSIHPPIHSCMGSTPWHRRQPQEASCRLHNLPNCTRMLLPLTPKGGSVAAFAAAVEDIASRLDPKRHIMVSCTKGILNDTLETVDEILHRVLPPPFHGRLAFLSGPSFAAEVARGLPSAVTIAAREEEVAMHVQLMLSTARFRCYRTNDVTGCPPPLTIVGYRRNLAARAALPSPLLLQLSKLPLPYLQPSASHGERMGLLASKGHVPEATPAANLMPRPQRPPWLGAAPTCCRSGARGSPEERAGHRLRHL